jgi:AcrR family transcriptional regulator
MPPKSSARTEKIVEAAARLFARQGYHGTSTREIARMAEVSENTLFRHFGHKEDIFWSALRSHTVALTLQWDLLDGIRGGDAPEAVLPQILELLIHAIHCKPEVLRLMAIACLELHGQAETLCRDLLSPHYPEISKYLAATFEKDEVLTVDPSLVAASAMAILLIQPQISKFTNGEGSSQAASGDAVRAFSKFWLDVLSPRLLASSRPVAQPAT